MSHTLPIELWFPCNNYCVSTIYPIRHKVWTRVLYFLQADDLLEILRVFCDDAHVSALSVCLDQAGVGTLLWRRTCGGLISLFRSGRHGKIFHYPRVH